MLAVLRCDASPRLGGGHVMRCLTLAARLRRAGWDTAFAVVRGSLEAVPALGRDCSRVVELADGADAAVLAEAFPDGCGLLVVDHYGLDAKYEAACRGWAGAILAMDDLADREHDCDWLLDPTLGRVPADYAPFVASDCTLLLGPGHALLRGEFSGLRSEALARRGSSGTARALVSFGLTDPAGATAGAIRGLAELGEGVEVEAVLGASAPAYADAVGAAESMRGRGRVLGPVDNMARRMIWADVAAGAAGSTSWERCCLGLPTVLAVLADNQRMIARELDAAGAAVNLGPSRELRPDDWASALGRLLRDVDARREMGCRAAALCDGRGAERVTLAVAAPERGRDGDVRLRLADSEDVWTIFDWQCAPQTRRFARNPHAPDREEHAAWFAAKLADPNAVLAVVEHGGNPAGVLRLDPVSGSAAMEVSILTAPEHCRKGVASAALRLASRVWADVEIHAEVLPDNDASHRLFAGVGYEPMRRGWYRLAPRCGQYNGEE